MEENNVEELTCDENDNIVEEKEDIEGSSENMDVSESVESATYEEDAKPCDNDNDKDDIKIANADDDMVKEDDDDEVSNSLDAEDGDGSNGSQDTVEFDAVDIESIESSEEKETHGDVTEAQESNAVEDDIVDDIVPETDTHTDPVPTQLTDPVNIHDENENDKAEDDIENKDILDNSSDGVISDPIELDENAYSDSSEDDEKLVEEESYGSSESPSLDQVDEDDVEHKEYADAESDNTMSDSVTQDSAKISIPDDFTERNLPRFPTPSPSNVPLDDDGFLARLIDLSETMSFFAAATTDESEALGACLVPMSSFTKSPISACKKFNALKNMISAANENEAAISVIAYDPCDTTSGVYYDSKKKTIKGWKSAGYCRSKKHVVDAVAFVGMWEMLPLLEYKRGM